MDPDTSHLEDWLSQILDRDAATFENAYWGTRPDAALAVPRLLQLLPATHDAYSRGKILELLGESGDPSVAETISADLTHPDQQVRKWAKLALSALDQGTPWQQREWQ
jgi:HEAT repeat protein